ncbi:class I SAM-dependent methyltransferase [Candidatus Pelagibacter ubique]|nr:class I SAM-dependent methyltransferase [Candidatus Pelagibacter ubique]
MKLLYLLNRVKLSLKHSGIRQTFKKIVHTILKGNKIDLDDLLEESPKTLDEIFIKFGTDKGSLDGKKTYYHYYRFKESNFNSYLNWIQRKNIKNYKYQLGLNSTPTYEKFFKDIRNEKLKILELGVANGHSIASWHHYFKNSMIYGLDMKNIDKFFYKSKRVKYFQIDIFNKQKIKTFINDHGPFDFIIDDSMNTRNAMITNLKNFFPSLKPGGLFFLEDVAFFTLTRGAFKDIENYNKKKGHEYFIDNRDMQEMFLDIMNENYSPDEHLTKSEIDYFKENILKIEVPKYEHPHAGMIIFFKKKN